jgi:hypothetical protein
MLWQGLRLMPAQIMTGLYIEGAFKRVGAASEWREEKASTIRRLMAKTDYAPAATENSVELDTYHPLAPSVPGLRTRIVWTENGAPASPPTETA